LKRFSKLLKRRSPVSKGDWNKKRGGIMMEVGRVCVKLTGREAGKKCVVVDVVGKNYVLITGPKSVNSVKRRRCNMKHLEPTDAVLKLEKNASDKEVERVIKKSGVDY
jgi:large subunit ribosomal protein L14e